jgi:deoxyribodipyrimidine photo-lyase
MIENSRIQILNDKKAVKGKYVVYWMQASQRVEYNHALEYAIQQANELGKPLIVFFGLTDNFPSANYRHYAFMLDGLKEVNAALNERGIKIIVRHVSPEIGINQIAKNASLVAVDRGYTRIQRYWRKCAAGMIDCPLIQIESDVVVPLEEVSAKEEYSAATIRGKIHRRLKDFLTPLKSIKIKKDSLSLRIETISVDETKKRLARLKIDRSVKSVNNFVGGLSQAKIKLEEFISGRLKKYDILRNDPNQKATSDLSPYLHFGQISPLYIALRVVGTKGAGRDAFLEELIVRRELSMNFVSYNQNYDTYDCLPDWCKITLKEHEKDKREYIYSIGQLEKAETHDPYWNAAQEEMVYLGKMHGYMRMYWGKKILEWTERPEEAYRIALYLNDKYELDGRDPNGYAGVAWCFGMHDRPWQERPIFGKIRYMNAEGLRRKFDADQYVKMVEEKCGIYRA